uniref:LOW QUALITY PROTEIN: ciliogenesis and planar polarity effector 2-like n=1 Tax=Ciona intestinalis TaxID=7719 RepID=UPI0005214220|nr:LOW QUALITY PROTEIN: ciliogenesis and planar polarity effector 2-like [Ciona intestinalis]|eukprot:XP_009861064.1 LOW QUALITY PROTEIN: ciliogenesis and planar polarity effector 2-like [Ciona intestinalis]
MEKQFANLVAIDSNWLNTPSAKDYIASLLHQNERRHFGLLERPSLSPSKDIDIIKYKVFLCGKSGGGKTATVANISGCGIPKTVNETGGIETTIIYWPARLLSTGKLVFFCLQFWDVGDHAVKKFDHILPSCVSNVDCIMLIFSLTDRSSFHEIPQLLNQLPATDERPPVHIVVATKKDQFIHSDVSENEMLKFSQLRNIPIFKMRNKTTLKGKEHIFEISSFMNRLCDLLLQRDQKMAESVTREVQ